MTTRLFCRHLWILIALGALAPAPLIAQEFRTVHEVESRYQRITVVDTAGGYRQLIFDGKFDGTDAIQSEMNLADPNELTLSYARHIMAALPLVAEPKHILIVGLGGASMQRYLRRLLPGAVIETAELDPALRAIAADYFFFKEDEHQIVHVGDGRKFIENSKDRFDIIFLDAFTAASIPYSLATQEFLSAVKGRVAPGGLVCANLWDQEPGFPDMVKTYSVVFPELHTLKCAASGNLILLAFPQPAALTIQGWAAKAEAFEQLHPTGLDLPLLIKRGAAEKTIVSDAAKVLLDKDRR